MVNFYGMLLTVSILHSPPFVIINNKETPETFDGIEILVLNELARQLNFTIRYHVHESYGLIQRNGSVVAGLKQHIQEGRSHLAVVDLWDTSVNYQVADFGPALHHIRFMFLVRRPKVIPFNCKMFTIIFQPLVGIVLVLSSLVTVLLFRWTLIQESRGHVVHWGDCILTMIGYISQTASNKGNLGFATRLTLISWSLFSFFFTVYLSSDILTRLSLPHYTTRVDSIRQMVERKYYWTSQYYADINNEEIKRNIFNLINPWHRVFEKRYTYVKPEVAEIMAISEENLAFSIMVCDHDIAVLRTLGIFGRNALRKYRLAKEFTGGVYVSFGVKKSSPLLEPLTQMTLRFTEHGLLEYWKRDVLRRWPIYNTGYLPVEEDKPTPRHNGALPFKRFVFVFYILLFGLSVSIVVFYLEVNNCL